MSSFNLDLGAIDLVDPVFHSMAPGAIKLPTFLHLVTGKYYDILRPDPSLLTKEVIAVGLARMNRYGNQSRVKILVGQHSLATVKHLLKLCTKKELEAEPWLPLGAQLHDGSEALLLDLPTQIKQLLPHYKLIEDRTMDAIAVAFGLPTGFHHHKRIAEADRVALSDEIENIHGIDPASWGKQPAKHGFIKGIMARTKTEKSCVKLFIQTLDKYEKLIK
jgi:hypothetical protein